MTTFREWLQNEEVLRVALGLMFTFPNQQPLGEGNVAEAMKLVERLKERKDDLYALMRRTYHGWKSDDIYEDLRTAKPNGPLTPQDKDHILVHFGIKEDIP